MNDTAQIITAIATLIGVAGGIFVQIWSLLASLSNGRAIADVHAQTDGMAKRLEAAAEIKGNVQGRIEEKAESAARK